MKYSMIGTWKMAFDGIIIGFLIFFTEHIAPNDKSFPSMKAASNSSSPSIFGRLPKPTELNDGLSSI